MSQSNLSANKSRKTVGAAQAPVQHTPGPWSIRKSGNKRPDWEFIFGEGGVHVATATQPYDGNINHHGPDSAEEAEANSRLIAAAPELLREAKSLVWIFQQLGLDHDYRGMDEHVSKTVEAARAAIAKAEGPA